MNADSLLMQGEGKRYEMIAGELVVSDPCHWYHQLSCAHVLFALGKWNDLTCLGVANLAPGLIFNQDDEVAPDVVWVSNKQLALILGEDGMLHGAPELIVETLSIGKENRERDQQIKLKLYSRHNVHEYWIVDWEQHRVEIYRRDKNALTKVSTQGCDDILTSPLLPCFACKVSELFQHIPGPYEDAQIR